MIVASTRAAAGVYPDRTGPLLVEWLRGKGFHCEDAVVVADGPDLPIALRGALTADLVITSGGTGLTPTDGTPEATAALLDYQIPGLADALRREGADKVPTAILSRGVAGVAGRTLVVNLPGSTGGVKDGMAVLDRVLDHALDQLAGGDHPGSGTG
ncbi:MogA/MoaB family molybdenum cofactor biosynthesis protein [Nakamurella alba]|uniref:MogA/MoaB family molybdenum cofactor biosynthesis protein n=1 Tax=Nakamurella alba TaxID=2665158 RepID=UPI003898FC90